MLQSVSDAATASLNGGRTSGLRGPRHHAVVEDGVEACGASSVDFVPAFDGNMGISDADVGLVDDDDAVPADDDELEEEVRGKFVCQEKGKRQNVHVTLPMTRKLFDASVPLEPFPHDTEFLFLL